tara:strand:+ start:141 stop:323 length:183 start_codon:yes stop_codon:yes gene_type:complete
LLVVAVQDLDLAVVAVLEACLQALQHCPLEHIQLPLVTVELVQLEPMRMVRMVLIPHSIR